MNMYLGDYPAVYCSYCSSDYVSKRQERAYSNSVRVSQFECFDCGRWFTIEHIRKE